MNEKCTAIPSEGEPITQHKKNISMNIGLLKDGF
jgi:hypothetical protein